MEAQASKLGEIEIIRLDYQLQGEVEKMERFKKIYIHNTYKHTDLRELLDFHKKRGFAGIGYHFAISDEGKVYQTRPLDIQGAHVYGMNKESVGVVFLDVDKCSCSLKARTSFKQLVKELSKAAGEELVIRSHTYGQFEYINKLIEEHNKKAERKVPRLAFDECVAEENVFEMKKQEAIKMLKQNEQLKDALAFTKKLKICPGPHYFSFK